MNTSQVERGLTALECLALQFGRIADALEGINDHAKSAGNKFWPEPREPREAVASRVKTEEDLAKENQGRIDESVPIVDWLNLGEQEEWMGERTTEYLRTHPDERNKLFPSTTRADAGSVPDSGQESRSVETAEGEIGATGDSAADNTAV